MAVGSYLTGKHVAKKEYEKDIEDFENKLLLLKKQNNELIVKIWKLETETVNKPQTYWDAENEFYRDAYIDDDIYD